MILDTTVLVDLQKELRRGLPAPAARLLEASGDEPVLITFVTYDLWIAARGLQQGHTVVSRNAQPFERVPRLLLRSY